MRFLLDTCVISDFAQGQPETLVRIKAASPENLAASALTEMEVAYGLFILPAKARTLTGPIWWTTLSTSNRRGVRTFSIVARSSK
jgi:predicted nucleic acid-binding protein